MSDLTVPTQEVAGMGRVEADVLVTSEGDRHEARTGARSQQEVRRDRVRFLVDTGAAMVCLPPGLIDKLGLYQTDERPAKTPLGRVMRKIYSPVQLEVMDRRVTQEVTEIDEVCPPLLGYLALEALDLYRNPSTRRLEGNPAHGGQDLVDLY